MFYGWVILAAVSGIYFFAVGSVVYGFSVIIPEMIEDMRWSRSQASLGFSILVMMLGIFGPVAAILLHRVGARKLMGAGGLIAMAGAIGCYYMNSLTQYYVIVSIIAVGIAMLGTVACQHTLANWFARKRALALGIYMSMGGLGAFFAAPFISYLVQSTGSWRDGWLVMAFATLIGAIVAVVFVRDYPADKGTFVDGIDPGLAGANSDAAPSPKVHQTDVSWEVKDAARTMPFWTTVLAAAAAVFGYFIISSQGVLHMGDLGISPIIAASAIGIIGMFGAGGRLFTGFFGDRFDPRYFLAGGLALEVVSMIMVINVDSTVMVYAFAVVLGAGNGMAIVASPALVANYYGAKNYAGLIAIHALVVILIGATGPIVASRVFEAVNSYTPVFITFAAVAIIPVIMTLFMRPPVPKLVQSLDGGAPLSVKV